MRTKTGLKLLGLAALVMGVMAIGTVGAAQAEVGACWGYLNGAELKCFSESLEAKPLLAIENELTAAATLLVGPLNIEITCRTAAFINGGTLTKDGTILLGKVLFGKCFARRKTDLGALGACTPEDSVDGPGTIVTQSVTGLIVLHNTETVKNEPVVLIKPKEGTLLAVIEMPECAVSTALELRGELIIADVGGKAGAETHALSHLIIEHPTLHLMTIGGLSALIDGSAVVTLASPHNELKWGMKTTK